MAFSRFVLSLSFLVDFFALSSCSGSVCVLLQKNMALAIQTSLIGFKRSSSNPSCAGSAESEFDCDSTSPSASAKKRAKINYRPALGVGSARKRPPPRTSKGKGKASADSPPTQRPKAKAKTKAKGQCTLQELAQNGRRANKTGFMVTDAMTCSSLSVLLWLVLKFMNDFFA